MAQILVYHGLPKTYVSQAFGGVHNTEIDELRKLRTNTDIKNSPYKNDAWKFLEEIRERMDVRYYCDGSTGVNSGRKMKKIKDVLNFFGFSYGYGGSWDYYEDANFDKATLSIRLKKTVYVRGNTKSGNDGHQWILDGYKQIINRSYFADYYFDEYGKFNTENRYTGVLVTQEFVHANMGWGSGYLVWVPRGVYVFYETNYNGYLDFLDLIYPLP